MALIASISGIRGTIGGTPKYNLTPLEITQFSAAYAQWLKANYPCAQRVIVGRDSRPSGAIVSQIVSATLQAMGFEVWDIGLNATPTIEMAVIANPQSGGIILSASHNPKEWNALKLLTPQGEFLNSAQASELLKNYNQAEFEFAPIEKIGKLQLQDSQFWAEYHINKIIALEVIDIDAIQKAKFRVCVDCINSVGAVALPFLFQRLGIEDYLLLNADLSGNFAHNPEPLSENLTDLCHTVANQGYDVGFALDPDADRLAIVAENGEYFGEEYTIVAIADYLLDCGAPPVTVSNLSSSRALADLTKAKGGQYYCAPVGEANVIQKMKEVGASFGGEGNGGVIYPALHYGRDGLLGIALFLSALAQKKIKPSAWRKLLPSFEMYKTKLTLPQTISPALINEWWQELSQNYREQAQINTEDGLKLDFVQGWVHLRLSNTEPILRIYTEAATAQQAELLAMEFARHIESFSQTIKIY
jgi:phosphomannomutase